MANEITKIDAMVSLRPGAHIYGYADNPEWGATGNEAFVEPSEEEVAIEQARLQAEYDAKQYQRARAVEYPAIADQLDMLYHDAVDGTTTWQEAVAAVKAAHPKLEA